MFFIQEMGWFSSMEHSELQSRILMLKSARAFRWLNNSEFT